MDRGQFWHLVEGCRQHATDMASFNAVLEGTLTRLTSEEIWSFHKWVWRCVNELQCQDGFNEPLNECLDRHVGLQIGGDTGDCYVGWVIAQGRKFYETLLNEPHRAGERLPAWDDVWEGESVIFLPNRVFRERTGEFLQDVFGDDMTV